MLIDMQALCDYGLGEMVGGSVRGILDVRGRLRGVVVWAIDVGLMDLRTEATGSGIWRL